MERGAGSELADYGGFALTKRADCGPSPTIRRVYAASPPVRRLCDPVPRCARRVTSARGKSAILTHSAWSPSTGGRRSLYANDDLSILGSQRLPLSR